MRLRAQSAPHRIDSRFAKPFTHISQSKEVEWHWTCCLDSEDEVVKNTVSNRAKNYGRFRVHKNMCCLPLGRSGFQSAGGTRQLLTISEVGCTGCAFRVQEMPRPSRSLHQREGNMMGFEMVVQRWLLCGFFLFGMLLD